MAERRKGAPLVVAALVGLALIVVARSVGGGDGGGAAKDGGDQAPPSNRGCTVVQLNASSEKAALLKEIAADWARTGPEVDGTCARVEVTSTASGGAADALARGWNERVDGPRPHVWSPAASTWAGLLRHKTSVADRPDLVGEEPPPTIATSPLVIAMPEPMAKALGWPVKPLGWGDVLKLAQDPRGWAGVRQPYGAFTLGKTNPNFSTSGLHATVGAYFAATGTSSDLTLKNLDDPRVQAYAQGVERAVVHYGDTTLTFLTNLQKADDRGQGLGYISAVTVEEKSVWDYNQGNPSGDPATLGKHAKPKTRLAAIYPKEGTLLSDSPYIVLQAPWVTDPIRKAAEEFLDYVRSDDAQDRFKDAAFRGHDGKAGNLITQANGLLPKQPSAVIDPPAPAVLAKAQSLWNAQRKGARVLLVVDSSGSMGEPAGNGSSKLELAKAAALRALDQFGPRDDVALWSFSTPLAGSSKPYRELVPFTPINQAKPKLRQQISLLQADGGTALYATARQAFETMSRGTTRDRISAVILLTDGKNEYPPDTDLDSLVDLLAPEDTSRSVRFFPIAYGGDADLAALRSIAEAARGAAYDASDAASIDKVFTAVLSNF